MSFSSISLEQEIDILKYLLEYNADIYKNNSPLENDFSNIIEKEEKVENNIEEKYDEPISDNSKENEFHFDFLNNSIDNDYDEEKNTEINIESPLDDFQNDNHQEFHFNDIVKDDISDMPPVTDYDFSPQENSVDAMNYTPVVDVPTENSDVEEKQINLSSDNSENYQDDEEKVSTNDLQMLLNKYDIQEENSYINELVVGDINNYESILNTLKDNNLIDIFKDNSDLLVETLLYSDSESILNVLDIIKNDLSVDEEDYLITTKIVINTIPSIFVKHNGNYDNFVKNIKVFKELELNLINLFDFSKELFVASNDRIVDNLDIVTKYDIKITYQNAKYLLLLPNIGDKLDYYVESVYLDKDKNETFDGLEYINLYTAKLNVVTDETIKRLRYSSESGKKLFGSKHKSLVGEITNLKVNSLDISKDYLDKFFNNEFEDITSDEVREYTKLIHSSSNVGNYSDELDLLEKFHNGQRYVINDINISYNKVLRNYSILRSYGIDAKKALNFAVCYNLVITKEEYGKLQSVLNELGGNL